LTRWLVILSLIVAATTLGALRLARATDCPMAMAAAPAEDANACCTAHIEHDCCCSETATSSKAAGDEAALCHTLITGGLSAEPSDCPICACRTSGVSPLLCVLGFGARVDLSPAAIALLTSPSITPLALAIDSPMSALDRDRLPSASSGRHRRLQAGSLLI
jgi:hypothetical protein